MGLLTYTNMEDGVSASANLWNTRFGAIIDTINGNLDTDNLAMYAVHESNIAPEAVTSSKIAEGAILPSHVGNTWVGRTDTKSPVANSTYFTIFNKTITLSEASYIYALVTASGTGYVSNVDPGVRILVNDVTIEERQGGAGGFELLTAKLNADYPFAISGISTTKLSGNINVKVQVKSNVAANGWGISKGFIRIDALSDGTYLV